jgi:hypothetical protein
MLFDAQVDFHTTDLLAAIKAALEAAWCRLAGSAVDNDSTWLGVVTAGQVRRNRSSSRRHSPSRVQRANNVNRVLNGMSQSSPMPRHCMPQKHRHQIALRSATPANAGFGPDRVDREPSTAIAVSSTSTSSTKASTSAKASQETGDVFAVLTAVPI